MTDVTKKTTAKLADLTPDRRNVNAGTKRGGDMLRRSLQQYGAARSIVTDREMRVLCGNQTVEAAGQIGIEDLIVVPTDGSKLVVVQRTDLDLHDGTSAARELTIADNRTNQVGFEVDPLVLAEHAADGIDLGLFWFDDEIEALDLPDLEPLDLEGDDEQHDDEQPVPQGSNVTRLGDVWLLGDHRLICGDSSDDAVLATVMGDDRADLVFTDPPYNLAEHNPLTAGSVRKAYSDLAAAQWDQGFEVGSFLAAVESVLADDCSIYVCTSHHLAGKIWQWMANACKYHGFCVWSKTNPMPSLTKRHWTFSTELICYGTRGRHVFNFPDQGHALSVWTMPSGTHVTEHPTEKPIDVAAHAIKHSSQKGAIVFDGFGGSGTTLIACEQLARRARLVELDPGWCDVIVRRWQQHTGKAAVHADGTPFGTSQNPADLK